MAGNSKRAIVRLESSAGTGYRYTVTKNKSTESIINSKKWVKAYNNIFKEIK